MLLYGSGGHAKVIIDCLLAHKVQIKGVFDDFSKNTQLLGYPVLGAYEKDFCVDEELLIAIGDNRVRKKLVKKIGHGYGLVSHPSATISSSASIGQGTVVFHHAVIQSGTVIGKHAIINTAAVIEHDCDMGDFTHVSPNATLCGSVTVGEGTHIGAGAIVIPNISIGRWATIGAGAVIIEDVPDHAVVVGNQGKIIKFGQ